MDNKAFFDPAVFDKIIDLIFKHKNPVVASKMINFLSNTDCYVYPGFWNKNRYYNDFKIMISKKGRLLHSIKGSSQIEDQIRDTPHYKVGITNKVTSGNETGPVYTLDELIALMTENDTTCYLIKEGSAINDFKKTMLHHTPTSIIINDRYFFNRGIPERKLIYIIENLIESKFEGKLNLTLFYSEKQNTTFDSKSHICQIEEALAKRFPTISFSFELFKNTYRNSNHDRFIITDFVSYKSSTSFDFLTENTTSTINRYMIYECPDFLSNLKHLEQFLNNSKKSDLLTSKNGIINSFLSLK